MLEHSHDAIMVLDDDRRYLAMNRPAAEMLSRAPHELVGRQGEEVLGLDDTNACRHAAASEILVWGRLGGDGVATLRVSDDGGGFDPALIAPAPDGRGGVGLRLMRERVRASR